MPRPDPLLISLLCLARNPVEQEPLLHGKASNFSDSSLTLCAVNNKSSLSVFASSSILVMGGSPPYQDLAHNYRESQVKHDVQI
jgi:hypothetical protein